MIIRVARQALLSGAQSVTVATDDTRIEAVVSDAGYQAKMTSSVHQSGSDRVMEVAEELGWPDESIVVNVQGDEPLIPPGVISQVAAMLCEKQQIPNATAVEVATLFVPIKTKEEFTDPNAVKVVTNAVGMALYFSRAPIPWPRKNVSELEEDLPGFCPRKRHIGIYAYTVRTLRRFVSLPVSGLESTEGLEQLRLLENAIPIIAESACEDVPSGIDTQDDYEKICSLLDGA